MQITETQSKKILAYLGDTLATALQPLGLPSDFSSKQPPTGLAEYPVIVLECTYLYQDHAASGDSAKHVHWNNLLP